MPCLLLALLPLPQPSLESLRGTVERYERDGLAFVGVPFQGSLVFGTGPDEGLWLAGDPPEGPTRVALRLWAHRAPAFRVYLAQRPGERVFLQSSGSAPSGLEGLYLERDAAVERLVGLEDWLPASAAVRHLDLGARLEDGLLWLRLDARAIEVRLPDGDWRSDLELRRVEGVDALMLDAVELASMAPGGGEALLASGRFSRLPFRIPVGIELAERLGEAGSRALTLVGSASLGLLLDLALLGLLGLLGPRPPAWRTWVLGWAWPLHAALLILSATALHLPYSAAALALASSLLLRLLLGLWPGGPRADRSAGSRVTMLLPAALGLLSCGALAGIGALLLPTSPQRWTWGILCALPLMVQATAVALRAASRGGGSTRVGTLLALLTAGMLLLEGVLAIHPGLDDLLGSEHGLIPHEIDHRLLGDPFGELTTADSIEVGSRRWAVPAPEGTYRVVCLGSSSTEGLGAEHRERESWPGRLRALLAARGVEDVEVINAGIIGASTTQLQVYLEQVLLPLEPDLVVLYFGGNLDSDEAGRFYRDLHDELEGAEHLRSPERLWAARQLRYDPPWAVSGFLLLCRSRVFMAAWGLATGRVEEGPVRATFGPRVTPKLIPATARRLVELCAGEGIPLVLIPEVLRTAVLEPDNPDAENIPGRTWHYSELFAQLAEEHADEGVRYASVHDAFSPAEAQRFFLDEQHMNAEGYDHLARAILSALDEQALLPRPAADDGGEAVAP